jgi:hypothetical protein
MGSPPVLTSETLAMGWVVLYLQHKELDHIHQLQKVQHKELSHSSSAQRENFHQIEWDKKTGIPEEKKEPF